MARTLNRARGASNIRCGLDDANRLQVVAAWPHQRVLEGLADLDDGSLSGSLRQLHQMPVVREEHYLCFGRQIVQD